MPLLFLAGWASAFSQGSDIPSGSTAYPIIDRLEIKSGLQASYFSGLKNYSRGDVARFALVLDTTPNISLSPADREDLLRIFKDNNEWISTSEMPVTIAGKREGIFQKSGEDSLGAIYRKVAPSQIEACVKDGRYVYCKKPIFGIFYKTPANWFELNKPAFHLRVNPILNLKLAKEAGDGEPVFLAQRGIELRGGIDDRVWFYTNIVDALTRFPDYVNEYVSQHKAIPGQGYFKPYKSQYFDITNGYDYLNGQAELGFNVTRHVSVQFGHGKNFIGNGYRSLLLSDFSNNYLNLKLHWRIGKLHYQNLFAEISALSAQANPGENLLPKKYMAAHYLGFDFLPGLSFGLYEATIFSRDGKTGHFELQYLNPVILYRTVELLLDSPDNVLIGLNAKANLLHRFQIYAQLMMDEFKFGELIVDNQGWWANKYGIQAGLKYINAFGIEHLDLQVEYNMVRPYTYSYSDSLGANYSHYSQPLAHPLGANFKEFIGTFRWQPFRRWTFEGRFIRAKFGEDENGTNWGGNIFLNYESRELEYGNETGQGVATSTTLAGLDASFELWHNLFLDLHWFYRKKTSNLPEREDIDRFIGGGVRMNIGQWRQDF